MDSFIPSHIVEQFHLLFLAFLGRKVDKSQYAVKGGCNLRFFLGSVRYSDDMDLDADGIDIHVLRERVNGILASQPFAQVLGARGIAIEHVTEHKQTDTTQRWKVGLAVAGAALPLPTKIEFSRRGLTGEVLFESVDPGVVHGYQLPPVMANHYSAEAAFRQKLQALASRRVTQARDIFDLHHLLMSGAAGRTEGGIARGGGGVAGGIARGAGDIARGAGGLALDAAIVDRARSNAMAIDFATFKSQLLSYLPPDTHALYDSAAAWETMVLEVVEALERIVP